MCCDGYKGKGPRQISFPFVSQILSSWVDMHDGHLDRPNTNLPARFPASLSPHRDFTPALPADQTGTPALQINPRMILRGLNRQWWRILALWLVVSAPIVVLIYQFVQPTYEAVSLLLIEPAQQDLFSAIHTAGMLENPNATTTYLETQVGLIKSTKVLNPAIADPLVVNLPTIKKSEDPKSDLLEKLKVGSSENEPDQRLPGITRSR